MATDPEGYLKWADGQLASQVQQRQDRLAALSAKKGEISKRRQKFAGDFEEIANLEKRMGTATRRADEEGRWPVTIAGRQFSKEEADRILQETRQFLDERRSLAASYDDAVARLDAAAKSLRDDVSRLTALRDKVSVDLERVRIDRSTPQLDKLRKTELEIEHYSRVLTATDDVNVQALPEPKAVPANLHSMLK
jgi:chromosome segregation ATPase